MKTLAGSTRDFVPFVGRAIAMALAAALHHSAGPREKKVELQQYAALWGQNTGARAREGEVHEKYGAPRRQNAPHLGERPGSVFDPGLQRSDRSLRRSAGDSLPTLALPSLAGSAGAAVDSSSLRFFPAAALRRRKEEEEKVKKEAKAQEKVAESEAQQQAAAALEQARLLLERNKRKKRRRRRTPRTSSRSLRGRARRRQRQWYFHGWLRWLRCISRCVPSCRTKLLGIMAGVDQRDSHVMVPMVRLQKTVESRLCRFGFAVLHLALCSFLLSPGPWCSAS